MVLARLTALVFTLYITLGQRFTIGAATGGRGNVQPLEILFMFLAALLWFRSTLRTRKPVARGLWLPTIGPLFALLVLLPILGVVVGGYEFHTLYSFTVVLVPLSIFVLGQASEQYGVDIRNAAFAAILAQGFYGFAQMLSRVGLMPEALWGWATRWDSQSQTAINIDYVLSARSTGLFLNPNEFGMWSVLAVIFSAVYLRKSKRLLGVILGALGVICSQSRTAWTALLVLLIGYLVASIVMSGLAKRAILVILLASPLVTILALLGVFSRLVEANSTTRLLSGLDVLTQGASADPNLAGRYDAWGRVRALAAEYTFGTLGPPEIKFGGSIDNQFASFYLQGGVILVLAYVLALVAPFVLMHRGIPYARTLALMTGAIAIFSYTAAPIDSTTASALVWVAVAITFGALRNADHVPPDSLASPHRDLAPPDPDSGADLRGDHDRELSFARMTATANLQFAGGGRS
jgi:hypothetical protein